MDCGLIYEKRIGSLSALKRELETIDGDAGVRVEGRFEGERCLAFVTRFTTKYTVVVCAKPARGKSLGQRIATREFTDLKSTVSYLASIAAPKVEAYAY